MGNELGRQPTESQVSEELGLLLKSGGAEKRWTERNTLPLKEAAQERSRSIRDADNLVRCLTIEFEIELGLGSTVVPVRKKSELAPPQAPLRQRGASNGDAHARRLPRDPTFLCHRFGRGDDAARDETWPAFVLAREHKDRIAFGDVLATIHRFLRAEPERLRRRIANRGFNREHHTPRRARMCRALLRQETSTSTISPSLTPYVSLIPTSVAI